MRWINRTQSSFSEKLFSVFIGRDFLCHHSPHWASKYHFGNFTRTVLGKASWGESYNPVRWIKRTQSRFSESFFAVFNWRYFLFHHSPLWASKYHCANSTKTDLMQGFLKESCKSVRWINRTQNRFSESFVAVFNWRYFLFHHSPLWASKYHFANSTRTVLAKGFLRGKL